MKKLYTSMAAVLLLFSLSLNAVSQDKQNVYWTGAVSDRWEDPGNWSMGDTIDAADGISGVYVDSLDLWIKDFDPISPQIWFTGSDGVTQYSFNVYLHIQPSDNDAVADTASHLIYNNLSAPAWTRPYHMYVDSGAQAIISSRFAYLGNGKETFYVNKDVHVNGKLILRDTAFVGSRNQTYVGTASNGELIVESGSEFNVKVITRLGAHKVGPDTTATGEPMEPEITDYIGKIIVRGGTVYPGGNYGLSWGTGTDIPGRANGSCVVIDSGLVSSLIRDLDLIQAPLDNPLVIINGGEFQCKNDALSIEFAKLNNVFAAGNGAELVYTTMEGYVSITNSNPVVSAIKKVKELPGVNVYPNPSVNGMFSINAPGTDRIDVTVYNSVGQIVHAQNYLSQETVQVNADLSKGMYIVEIASNGSRTAQKLIVR